MQDRNSIPNTPKPIPSLPHTPNQSTEQKTTSSLFSNIISRLSKIFRRNRTQQTLDVTITKTETTSLINKIKNIWNSLFKKSTLIAAKPEIAAKSDTKSTIDRIRGELEEFSGDSATELIAAKPEIAAKSNTKSTIDRIRGELEEFSGDSTTEIKDLQVPMLTKLEETENSDLSFDNLETIKPFIKYINDKSETENKKPLEILEEIAKKTEQTIEIDGSSITVTSKIIENLSKLYASIQTIGLVPDIMRRPVTTINIGEKTYKYSKKSNLDQTSGDSESYLDPTSGNYEDKIKKDLKEILQKTKDYLHNKGFDENFSTAYASDVLNSLQQVFDMDLMPKTPILNKVLCIMSDNNNTTLIQTKNYSREGLKEHIELTIPDSADDSKIKLNSTFYRKITVFIDESEVVLKFLKTTYELELDLETKCFNGKVDVEDLGDQS